MTRDTAGYTGLTVNLSINYGGRDEIIRAFNKVISSGAVGPLTEDSFRGYLDQPELPDPDLIIRSANEHRLSNFLLWESAYAELYFSPKLWPDWDRGRPAGGLRRIRPKVPHLRRRLVNWKGFRSRILLVGVAFPVLAILILVLPQFHHLGFNIIVVGATVMGALEMAALFRARGIPPPRCFPLLAATIPIGTYLEISGLLPAGGSASGCRRPSG